MFKWLHPFNHKHRKFARTKEERIGGLCYWNKISKKCVTMNGIAKVEEKEEDMEIKLSSKDNCWEIAKTKENCTLLGKICVWSFGRCKEFTNPILI